MPTNAMLYCPDASALSLEDIAHSAGLPSVEARTSPETGGTQVELSLGPVQVVLAAIPPDETRQQLEGLRTYLSTQCELAGPTVLARLGQLRGAFELAFEPGDDPEGAGERFLRALATKAQALVYRDDGSLQDASGQRLAWPREAPEGTPLPAPSVVALQPLERVARRALVVATLTWRASIEQDKPADSADLVAACKTWLGRNGLLNELEPQEAALLRAKVGGWSERDVRVASWGIEGAAVLAWALGLAELPAHDEQADAVALGRALGFLSTSSPALEVKALRPVAEIERMARRLIGLNLRLRAFASAPRPVDFAAFARECWEGGFDPEGLALAGADLAIRGQPLWSASKYDVSTAQSIASERHRGISWLMGLSPTWSTPAPAAPPKP